MEDRGEAGDVEAGAVLAGGEERVMGDGGGGQGEVGRGEEEEAGAGLGGGDHAPRFTMADGGAIVGGIKVVGGITSV